MNTPSVGGSVAGGAVGGGFPAVGVSFSSGGVAEGAEMVLREPPMPLGKLCTVLGEPTRWRVLRELARGEPLPVKERARRCWTSVIA